HCSPTLLVRACTAHPHPIDCYVHQVAVGIVECEQFQTARLFIPALCGRTGTTSGQGNQGNQSSPEDDCTLDAIHDNSPETCLTLTDSCTCQILSSHRLRPCRSRQVSRQNRTHRKPATANSRSVPARQPLQSQVSSTGQTSLPMSRAVRFPEDRSFSRCCHIGSR